MKCTKCGDNEVEMEDDRVSTDRGTFGSVGWFCENCGDVTEYVIEKREIDEGEFFREMQDEN